MADDKTSMRENGDPLALCLSLSSNKKHCLRVRRNTTTVPFNLSMSMSTSEWASLPEALTFLILDNLLEPIDHVRFAAVCKEWCYLSKVYNLATQRWLKVLPMLLIPFQLESQSQVETTGPTTNQTRAVYSINEGKVYENVRLPVPYSKICCGSSHGWLATIDLADQPINITLVNPFRKEETIRLPPLEFEARDMKPRDGENPYEDYVQKVILSTDPSLNRDNYVVVAIYRSDCRLAFTKAGENYWRSFHLNVTDAVFYKSKIYAVRFRLGCIISVDVEKSQAHRVHPFSQIGQAAFEYLVVSIKGDLLQVRMSAIKDGRTKGSWTESFCVYKVVFGDSNQSIQQVEVKDIGDEALFLGVNHSFSILASNFAGCKPNCIYHTCGQNPTGMNIFNLEDKSITRVQFPSPNCDQLSRIPRPIWIFPTFNGLCRFS